jgi:two-component system NarL family sensor kinase
MRQFFLVLGTFGGILLVGSLIWLIVFHQQRIMRFNRKFKRIEKEKQQILLSASIQFQEEERNRIAADLHDDAGPLLATARLYLSDNIVNQDKEEQLETVTGARQIIDDAIMLIRGISHNLMPPTLKNFGLESATVDIFQKINNSGVIKATAKFSDYRKRLLVESELHIFRIIQELVNNILKHSKPSFLHLTQHVQDKKMYFRIQHDGSGLVQQKFEDMIHQGAGLGLKNITSRINVIHGSIYFDLDRSNSFYKITLEVPNKTISKPLV